MNKLLRMITLLLLSNIAFAGGWVVGGGEIIEDATNPWFLNNTPIVRYCVLIDEANFGLKRNQAEEIVSKGIKFWIKQFDSTKKYYQNLPIAKQEFVLENCNQMTDLKFQFGNLDLEQIDQLKDISRKVAVSVRTEYDRVNLRGKGFVYISPESGPLKISNPRVIQNPWSRSNGILTQLVLIHELGHVFGLRHDNTLPLMEEDFVERIVSLEYSKAEEYYYLNEQINSLYLFIIGKNKTEIVHNSTCFGFTVGPIVTEPVNPNPNILSIGKRKRIKNNSNVLDNIFGKYFGFGFDPNCYEVNQEFDADKYYLKIQFYNSKNLESQVVKFDQVTNTNARISSGILLKLFLPKEQVVFKDGGYEYRYFGFREKSITFQSTYSNPEKNITRPAIITMYPNNDSFITTEFEGKVYTDFLAGY